MNLLVMSISILFRLDFTGAKRKWGSGCFSSQVHSHCAPVNSSIIGWSSKLPEIWTGLHIYVEFRIFFSQVHSRCAPVNSSIIGWSSSRCRDFRMMNILLLFSTPLSLLSTSISKQAQTLSLWLC